MGSWERKQRMIGQVGKGRTRTRGGEAVGSAAGGWGFPPKQVLVGPHHVGGCNTKMNQCVFTQVESLENIVEVSVVH